MVLLKYKNPTCLNFWNEFSLFYILIAGTHIFIFFKLNFFC